MTTRREFIGGVSAAAALAVVDSPVSVASLLKDQTPTIKPLPAWSVGDYGEMNWKVVFAETEEEAIRLWCIETHDEDPDNQCDCGCGLTYAACGNYGFSFPEAAVRAPHFDNPFNEEPTTSMMFEAGWTVYCDRCGTKCCREDGECAAISHEDPKRADIVVCHDCMTDDELRTVCPDHWRFDEEDAA